MAEYYGGKKNWTKWILIYIVVGAIVYGLVYYFFFRNSGYSGTNPYGY